MKKLKVLFITARSDSGGGPKHLYELCQNLKEFDISIAAPNTGEYAQLYQKLTNQYIEIPFRKFSFYTFFKLLFFVRENSIDVIHSHGRGAGIYAKTIAFFGVKLVHTLHGAHQPKNLKERIIIFVEAILKHSVDQFIFVSKTEKEISTSLKIAHSYGAIIANGVEEELFKNINQPKDQKILGTLSRLDSHKNNKELLSFLKQLPNYRLLIAGDGDEMNELKKKKSDNVTMLGHINDKDSFLSDISIYVSASKGEGLPYAILEAIAAKKRIIASDVAGHRDILPKENLYKLGSFKDFQEKLVQCKTVELKEKYTLKYSIDKTQEILLKYQS